MKQIDLLKKSEEYNIIKKSKYYNDHWYKKTYKIPFNEDGIIHYMTEGYKLNYNPSELFSAIKYNMIYEDVRFIKANPLIHYEKFGKYEEIFTYKPFISPIEQSIINNSKKLQNIEIKSQYKRNIKKLIVFLVPDIDTVSGGVMSICSIAKVSQDIEYIHGSKVIIATVPSDKTFNKYTKFDTDFSVYRFDQLRTYFNNLEDIIIHIPETYVHSFLYSIKPADIAWIRNVSNSTCNILNQNINIMPRPLLVDFLKDFFKDITITCAHKKYCVPQLRSSYNASVHWISTSNIVKYNYITYDKKQDILLYSPDYHPLKNKILESINLTFPNLQLIEITNMRYNDYLNLISQAKWMITFGEGLDGYFVETIRSGGIAFAVNNQTFFNEKYNGYNNIYDSYNEMLKKICEDISFYDKKQEYSKLNKQLYLLDKEEYNDLQYKNNIKKYYKKIFTYPIKTVIKERKKIIDSQPLVSIAMAVYNGEKYIKEQIDSLLNQTYKNIEIVISDDNSTDNTEKVIKSYGRKIKYIKSKKERSLNNNICNAIVHCKGEFIALCDQDDIWHPEKISILLNRIDEFDMIHGSAIVVDSEGNLIDSKSDYKIDERDKTRFYNTEDLIKENKILGCTSLIRAGFLKKCLSIPKDILFPDLWFAIKAIKDGNGICYCDIPVVYYRIHGDNLKYRYYNSPDWNDKKIKQNKALLENINKLTKIERKVVNNNNNYCLIDKAFNSVLPKDFSYLLSTYSSYFSDDVMNYIRQILNKQE